MKNLLLIVLWLILPTALPAAEVTEVFKPHTFQWTTQEGTTDQAGYRMMTPPKVEEGKTYPLVIFLHGAGERGSDNKNQLKYFPEFMAQDGNREAFPCYVLAPQCRVNHQWVDVPWSDKKSTPLPEKPSEMMHMVISMIHHTMTVSPIDPDRVYLTGLSMGGYGSWDLAMRQPQWFAAVAPVCGGGDERQAKRLVDIPLWAFHGTKDGVVPPERSREMIEAIKQAGGEPKYTEYPNVGHNAWSFAYTKDSGLMPWMFAQKRQPAKPE